MIKFLVFHDILSPRAPLTLRLRAAASFMSGPAYNNQVTKGLLTILY